MKKFTLLAAISAAMLSAGLALAYFADVPLPEKRQKAQKAMNAGNWKDAYELLNSLAVDPNDDAAKVSEDLNSALQCLQNLGRIEEIDEFREEVIKQHAGNWRLLQAAADSYMNYEHGGFRVAGKFVRGFHRGGGEQQNAMARDHIRALQLMVQSFPKVNADPNANDKSAFYLHLSQLLLANRGYYESWRLQYLTEIDKLPDYDSGYYYGFRGGNPVGAPVDEKGEPVFHTAPKTWEAATTDGQRWRWALVQAVEASPSQLNAVRMEFANFLHNQFGVQTMAQYGGFFGRGGEEDEKPEKTGPFAVDSLGEDETIAKLASGVKRFKLPDEFNYIKIFQQIADEPKTGHGFEALESLAGIFENRRQYDKAADTWKRAIKEYGPGDNNYRKQRLEQILGNWGRFESSEVQPAGKGAELEFVFRNAKQVDFEAHEVKIDKLLADIKAYLKDKPKQLDWQKTNLQNIGDRLVGENQTQYVGKKLADWKLDLKPREKHYDRRLTVATPLRDAGVYLVTAKLADGNIARSLVWVNDTAVLKKSLSGNKTLYYVADSRSGKPLEKANLEFIGHRQRFVEGNKWEADYQNFAESTNADGQVQVESKDDNKGQFQWLVIARTDDKESPRFTFLGMTYNHQNNYYDAEYNQTKVFTITDRPVYRPAQKVHFKFWVRHAKYDQADTSSFANQDFAVELHNPKGEKILDKTFKADAYGGLEGEYDLPSDATLGVYQIYVRNHGGGNFRVEEYKKPEFEVKVDAPSEPLMLGEKIKATIKAKYYFGAPVVKAKVKYKITRESYSEVWYPYGRWDWLFGRGYWWFAYDYTWYPGWNEWGCQRPIGTWWPHFNRTPPEVVAEVTADIGADGTLSVNIDTAVAKALHPDQDHKYSITAEVVDESRRTIVGTGTVLVARKPFKVTTWVDRGYYHTGDVIHFDAAAHTLDQKPVKGKGKLRLLKVAYKDDKPVETEVEAFDLNTDDQGRASQQLKAVEPGQYRFSYRLTDAANHAIEGGYVFTIIGPAFDGASVRFNDVELIPDKAEYKPGEKVKLQINVNRAGAAVLLFTRASNGTYLPPKLIRMTGKTATEEIEVLAKDMPNFFVEAVTVGRAKVFTEVKEIIVPPEQRVLDVAVKPSAESYRPGQKGTVSIKLTGPDGKPFVGTTVVTMYDKAVEYISGGSNVPEIKAFFWKWRRSHHPSTESNLTWMFYNLLKRNEVGMGNLGVFGHLMADRSDMLEGATSDSAVLGTGYTRGEGNRMRAADGAGLAAPMKMPMAKAAMDPAGAKNGPADKQNAAADAGEPPAGIEPTVRTKFADTALWVGSLTTDERGLADIKLEMPENLTTWKIKVWGMGHGTKVGQGEAEVVTKKDLIVRLQAPRFFVEKDEVVLSANVHNYLKTKKSVQVVLDLNSAIIKPLSDDGQPLKDDKTITRVSKTIEVAAGGEQRVDWRVQVLAEGQATVRMKALTDEESDAVEQKFPVFVHGMLKMDSFSGALRPSESVGALTINVPKERRIQQSRLEIRYSPTLAGAMVDALPYLAEYPYGCTEQTLNRFVPTVITQKILIDMGLDLKAIGEKRTNLNAQEIGDDKQRATQWKRFDRNPVFDPDEVKKMVKDGVQRLTEMQVSDGGWGWFSGYGERSYAHTTATVVHGLQIAQKNDVALVPGVLDRGVAWLKTYQEQQVKLLKHALAKPKPIEPYKDKADALDALVYMVLADAGQKNADMLGYLDRDRVSLPVYAKALFGLALEKQGEKDKLAMVMENIKQYVVEDAENQTAYLKLPADNYWWHWYGSEIEAQAYYLKLLTKTDPKGELAPKLVKYLLNNRKHATYWNSTRDTSLVIEAMAEFLKASGENKPELSVQVWIDGKQRKEVKITAADLFTFDNKFVLEGDGVEDGQHKIELKKTGAGPLYYNAYLTNFTLEDYIHRAGLEVKVNRAFYKLNKVDKSIKVAGSRGQAADQKVEKYERQELKDLATLKSGDLVEVELEIDSKNDYEYILFEDFKAAGFEAVDVRSGYNGNSLAAYMELRDNRVSFFVHTLARGKHSVSYRLRAEIPGKFSALPATAAAMYAPELRGNSEELKLKIED